MVSTLKLPRLPRCGTALRDCWPPVTRPEVRPPLTASTDGNRYYDAPGRRLGI